MTPLKLNIVDFPTELQEGLDPICGMLNIQLGEGGIPLQLEAIEHTELEVDFDGWNGRIGSSGALQASGRRD
ncbi:hypothetical protein [Paenibacillus sp. IITD108]|uniref:hypothetical protein n=1 Tax=Paenibacillus sp. IITD108 TaxID=3116649 RepID=UPI002F3E25DF